MQRGQCCRVALGYALKTLKPLEVIDGEATMVRRQGGPWGWGLQTVALADGETLLTHFSHLRSRHKPIRGVLT
jgi:hypothetical protein